MEIVVQNLRAPLKQSAKAMLLFNIQIFSPNSGFTLSSVGYRLLNGYIFAPSTRIKMSYLQIEYLDDNTAGALYDALEMELQDRGLSGAYQLRPKAIAIANLTLQALQRENFFPKELPAMTSVE